MSDFKVTKKERYYKVQLDLDIEYKRSLPVSYDTWDSFISKQSALNFINLIRGVKKHMNEINIAYDINKIICKYFNTLSNISNGFDLRSNLSHKEIANIFFEKYNDKYLESLNFCNNTLTYYKEEGIKSSYNKNWSNYDKHNNLIKEYKFDLDTIGYDAFDKDPLKMISSTLDKMIDLIDKSRALDIDESNCKNRNIKSSF